MRVKLSSTAPYRDLLLAPYVALLAREGHRTDATASSGGLRGWGGEAGMEGLGAPEGQPAVVFRDVSYPRREAVVEAERYWQPVAGPPPQGEEVVDEFLLGLPVEAIEHYVTTMEEGTALIAQSMRALAFWFRDRREKWVNARVSRRDPAVVALGGRASALASACLTDPAEAEAGAGELALALSLLGATADTLDEAGQRGAVDTMITCLGDTHAVAQSLSHNSAVTVPEACEGIGDLLTLDTAGSDEFHTVTRLLLGLWDVAPLAVSPARGAPPMPPLSHARAVSKLCERAYRHATRHIAAPKRGAATADDTAGMAAVPLAVLSRPASSSTTLSERILAVHIATGLLVGMLERYGGAGRRASSAPGGSGKVSRVGGEAPPPAEERGKGGPAARCARACGRGVCPVHTAADRASDRNRRSAVAAWCTRVRAT